jgi:VIT1/CCC1 family predicted Fe2+/Mn2+ transporter
MNSLKTDTSGKNIRVAQKNEITEYHVYQRLSWSTKNIRNKETLQRIADEEMKHYRILQNHSKHEEKPNIIKVYAFYFISKILGLTFGIKLMERGEAGAQIQYQELAHIIPDAVTIAKEEASHEEQLIGMIDEERLNYVGSVIRGLNDALVELTGALAGFTFALQDSSLIATAGLITGIAATLSMAGTEYLSMKSETMNRPPLKSAMYTGTTYFFTVLLLVFPYLLPLNTYLSLGIMIVIAILIITVFNFYLSVAKSIPFKERFLEMAGLSLGITAISFLIGLLVRNVLGVQV